jgi:hypothetical protein
MRSMYNGFKELFSAEYFAIFHNYIIFNYCPSHIESVSFLSKVANLRKKT